jgi:hypothetical protein
MSTATATAAGRPESWREARSNPEVNALVRKWKRSRGKTQDRLAVLLAALADPGSKHGYRGVQQAGGRHRPRSSQVGITVRGRRYQLSRRFPDAETAARALAGHLIERGVAPDDLLQPKRGGWSRGRSDRTADGQPA